MAYATPAAAAPHSGGMAMGHGFRGLGVSGFKGVGVKGFRGLGLRVYGP